MYWAEGSTCAISYMNMINKRGPNMLPWGTPSLTVCTDYLQEGHACACIYYSWTQSLRCQSDVIVFTDSVCLRIIVTNTRNAAAPCDLTVLKRRSNSRVVLRETKLRHFQYTGNSVARVDSLGGRIYNWSSRLTCILKTALAHGEWKELEITGQGASKRTDRLVQSALFVFKLHCAKQSTRTCTTIK